MPDQGIIQPNRGFVNKNEKGQRMDWLKTLRDLPFTTLIWLLPISLTLHELEEWNIMPWYQANFANPPQTPDHAAHTGLLFISALGFFVTLLASGFRNTKITAGLTLTFFIAIVFGNAMQHVYWLIAFDTYAPGVISAILLVMPVVVFITWQSISRNILPVAFVIPIYGFAVLSLFATVRAGDHVTEGFLKLHLFSEFLASSLGIGPQ